MENKELTITISKQETQRAICITIDELIMRLKNRDFYSPNNDDYVSVGRNTVIHRDDYIAALEDLKFKIKSEGNWID